MQYETYSNTYYHILIYSINRDHETDVFCESHDFFPWNFYSSSEEALDERTSETAWFNLQEERVETAWHFWCSWGEYVWKTRVKRVWNFYVYIYMIYIK